VITVAIGVAIALVIIAVRPAGASDGVASSANWQGPSPLPWFGGLAGMAQPGAQAFAGLATPTDACSIGALLITDVRLVDVADSVFETYVDDPAAPSPVKV
jgi:hypothetical protein